MKIFIFCFTYAQWEYEDKIAGTILTETSWKEIYVHTMKNEDKV